MGKRIALNVGTTTTHTTTSDLNNNNNNKEQQLYDPEVRLWLYDELIGDRKLSEIINETHENVKYLPGIVLTHNLHVTVDMAKTIQDADIVFIVIPHQHIHATLKSMIGHIKPNTMVVSMIKGLRMDKHGPELISSLIRRALSTDNVAVVMGANIASDVSTTIII